MNVQNMRWIAPVFTVFGFLLALDLIVNGTAAEPNNANQQQVQYLSAWIEAHKFYPQFAKQHGEQGTVFVRCTVMGDGQVVGVSLARSSGSSRLDTAAESVLSSAQVPQSAAGMSQPPITVIVPVRYVLEQ